MIINATKPSRGFFQELFGDCLHGGRKLELREIVRRGGRGCNRQHFFSTVDAFLRVVEQPKTGVNYYYGVHPRDGDNGTADSIKDVTCVHADLDDKNFAGGRVEARVRIRKFPLKPTAVIDTGHGLHAYWFFKEPEPLHDPKHFRALVRGVQTILGADQTDDLPRVLRVPGTLNCKNPEDPKPCCIIFCDYSRRYSPSDFHLFAEEVPDRQNVAIQAGAEISAGQRNDTLFRLGAGMRRSGFTESAIRAALTELNRESCKPPLSDAEIQTIAKSDARYEAGRLVTSCQEPDPFREQKWPEMPAEALQGLAGDFVKMTEPHTESDPNALLIQFLTSFGNTIGRRAHFKVEATKHHLNLYSVLVGETSKGRKGTSWSHNSNLFASVSTEWVGTCIQFGLSTGEGLIWAVRDAIEEKKPKRNRKGSIQGYETMISDHGVDDKRLLVVESEFVSVLKMLGRDGNILSAIIRQAWDSGNLRTLTKNSPAQATGAHVSIIGHITKNELLRHLDSTEAGNGFGNRFLWAVVRRSKCLPEGGQIHKVNFGPVVQALSAAVDFAQNAAELSKDAETREIWAQVYPELSEGRPGLLGAMIARSEAQTMRLAAIYALLDQSDQIRKEHLRAALAVWQYCEESARYIFGNALGDPVADDILKALKLSPAGLTRTEIRDLFKRNKSGAEITRALALLHEQHLAFFRREAETGGRPTERWRIAGRRYDENDLNDETR